jgi:hypothetical protein
MVAIPEYCKNSNRPKNSDFIKYTGEFRFVELGGRIFGDVITNASYCSSLNFKRDVELAFR